MTHQSLDPQALRQRILEHCRRLQRGLHVAASEQDYARRRHTIHRVAKLAREVEILHAVYRELRGEDDLPLGTWTVVHRAVLLGEVQWDIDIRCSNLVLDLAEALKDTVVYDFDE